MNIFLTTLALVLNPPAHSAQVHETWIQQGAPTEDQITTWSAMPGTRGYLFQLEDPGQWELEPLLRLRGADRLRIQTTRFPGEDTVEVYRQLAQRGAEFVSLDAGFPFESEIERLNTIGFGSCVFVVTSFPGEGEGERLSRLRCPTTTNFVTRMYPRHVDKEVFQELPATMPLLFSTDYWVGYHHMDVFNLLTQPIRLRISDMHAPEDSFPYLLGTRRLQDVTVASDYPPGEAGYWERFGALTVRWSVAGVVPSERDLQTFANSRSAGGQRYLIVDQDLPLTRDEMSRLERLPIQVEWIRQAPLR